MKSGRWGVVIAVVFVVALASAVSGCGRKNSPIPPEGSTYPQDYPTD